MRKKNFSKRLVTLGLSTTLVLSMIVAQAQAANEKTIEGLRNGLTESITNVTDLTNLSSGYDAAISKLQESYDALQTDADVPNFKVAEVTDNTVSLSWNKCETEGVTGYNIYWADKDTPNMKYKLLATVDANTLQYTMTGKATYVNYYFKIAANFASGTAAQSDAIKSATAKQFNVKLEKLNRGLVAAIEDNGIFLSWRLLADEVTGYSDTGLTGVNFNVYKNGEKIDTVTDSTNYLVEGGKATDTYYVEAIDSNGTALNQSEDVIICTAENYYDLPLQVPADGTIDRNITIPDYSNTYTYSANDVSVGDVDGDGEYEYFVKWYPSNSKDVSQRGFTGNTYIDCYKLDGTLLYRIDMGKNVRSGAHYTQFVVADFNGDGKAEISMQTAPGTKVVTFNNNDQNQIATESYITLPESDIAKGITNEDNYVFDAAQYREYLIGIFEDWGVWANDSDDMKVAKVNWDHNIENLLGVESGNQIVGHDGPYTEEEATKLADYFINTYAPARSGKNVLTQFEGFIITGPEYQSVFDGLTGKELDTQTSNFVREDDGMLWGDYAMARIEPGNRCDRFLSGMAYLDGENPYLIVARGYYTRTTLTAYKITAEGKLNKYWDIDSGWTVMTNPFNDGPHGMNGNDPVNGALSGQGNHQFEVGDVDFDGCQEIIYGGAIIDNDGKLYSSGTDVIGADTSSPVAGQTAKYGHGDSLHVTDIDPDRPGLEIFSCFEGASYAPYGTALRDAETNTTIFGYYTGKDTGRCMVGDLLPDVRGLETWGTFNTAANGEKIDFDSIGTNQSIRYAADMSTQILTTTTDATNIEGLVNGVKTTLLECTGTTSNNGTKGNACLIADVFGDWREELLVRTMDSSALRFYTSDEVTNHKLYTLMQDPQYRADVATQQTSYNQPSYTSFYLATDTDWKYVPVPNKSADTMINNTTSDKPSQSDDKLEQMPENIPATALSAVDKEKWEIVKSAIATVNLKISMMDSDDLDVSLVQKLQELKEDLKAVEGMALIDTESSKDLFDKVLNVPQEGYDVNSYNNMVKSLNEVCDLITKLEGISQAVTNLEEKIDFYLNGVSIEGIKAPFKLFLDAGVSGSGTADGYEELTDAVKYDAAKGYGVAQGGGGSDRSADALYGDFMGGNSDPTIVYVDLPEAGKYEVNVIAGDMMIASTNYISVKNNETNEEYLKTDEVTTSAEQFLEKTVTITVDKPTQISLIVGKDSRMVGARIEQVVEPNLVEDDTNPVITKAKAQVKINTTKDSEYTDMKIMSTTNTLDLKEVGFVVSLSDEEPEVDKTSCIKIGMTKVYTSIIADEQKITAEELGGKYIFTAKITNIANKIEKGQTESNFDRDIYVRPYAITDNDEIIYEAMTTFKVSDSYNK